MKLGPGEANRAAHGIMTGYGRSKAQASMPCSEYFPTTCMKEEWTGEGVMTRSFGSLTRCTTTELAVEIPYAFHLLLTSLQVISCLSLPCCRWELWKRLVPPLLVSTDGTDIRPQVFPEPRNPKRTNRTQPRRQNLHHNVQQWSR